MKQISESFICDQCFKPLDRWTNINVLSIQLYGANRSNEPHVIFRLGSQLQDVGINGYKELNFCDMTCFLHWIAQKKAE